MATILDLPLEILTIISSHLLFPDVADFGQTSHAFRKASEKRFNIHLGMWQAARRIQSKSLESNTELTKELLCFLVRNDEARLYFDRVRFEVTSDVTFMTDQSEDIMRPFRVPEEDRLIRDTVRGSKWLDEDKTTAALFPSLERFHDAWDGTEEVTRARNWALVAITLPLLDHITSLNIHVETRFSCCGSLFLKTLKHISCLAVASPLSHPLRHLERFTATGLDTEATLLILSLPSVTEAEIKLQTDFDETGETFETPLLEIPRSRVSKLTLPMGTTSLNGHSFAAMMVGPCTIVKPYMSSFDSIFSWERITIPYENAPQEAWIIEDTGEAYRR